MIKNINKTKVYVAMSGGVDSSVAAALLKQEGYAVTGVFFKPWSPFTKDSAAQSSPVFYCDWQQDRRDAMAVAEVLGIPFKTWDFSKEYKNKVGNYMIESYRRGITPNPDVRCNKEIKFGLFLKRALKEGADFIATGHYVKRKTKSEKRKTRYQLWQAEDKNKDQSYFLWTLTQEQLKYCLFPIGDYLKSEVRKLAKKLGLPTFDKKDSQGVCFIGQLNMKEFLKRYIPSESGKIIFMSSKSRGAFGVPTQLFLRLGKITKLSKLQKELGVPTTPLDGLVVGTHEGAAYYTIGQRHGLNITNGGGAYYVSGKDLRKNLVFVTKDEKSLEKNEILASNLNWINPVISGQGPTLPGLSVKARYRVPAVAAKIISSQDSNLPGLRIKTAKPIRAVTPGQSVVFYRGQEMLGGGIIQQDDPL